MCTSFLLSIVAKVYPPKMVAHLFTFVYCRWNGEIDLYEWFEEEIALHNITPTQTECTFSVHSFVVVNTNTKNGNLFFYFFIAVASSTTKTVSALSLRKSITIT